MCEEVQVQKFQSDPHRSGRSSAARLLSLSARLADEESFEEEELQVPGGDDEEAEGRRPPADVLRVGLQQEVVGALPHAAEAVVAEHVEGVFLHFVSRSLQTDPSTSTANKYCDYSLISHYSTTF